MAGELEAELRAEYERLKREAAHYEALVEYWRSKYEDSVANESHDPSEPA